MPPHRINASPPPLPQYSKSRLALRGLLIVAALIAVGLGAWPLLQEFKREDTPERFHQLSTLLLPSLPGEDAKTFNITDAEQRLAMDKFLSDLAMLGRECRDLAPIARTTEREMKRALALAESAPGAAGLVLAGVETAVGYSLGSAEIMETGSKSLIGLAKTYVDLFRELSSIRTTIEAQHVALFEQAPRFSAAPGPEEVLDISMEEEKPFFLNRIMDGDKHSMNGTQILTLTNKSGGTLSGCVISIRLIEEDGDSYRHVYSVASWRAGENRKITYKPGELFAETSTDVNRLQVQLYAAEKSSPVIELTRDGKAWPYFD